MTHKRYFLAVIVILATLAGGAAWLWFPWIFSPHYTIRIVSGPVGSEAQKFIGAFKREMAEERPRLRIEVSPSESLEASAQAFQGGGYDLAIVRSDHPAAASGGTIAIMRRQAFVVMTASGSRLSSMKDLAGKRIALLDNTQANDPLLKTIVSTYDLDIGNALRISPAEAGRILKEKRTAAVVSIGSVGPGPLAEAVRAITKTTGAPPKFIELDAKAIVAHNPVYDVFEVQKSAFSSVPAVPAEAVETVAIAIRFVARPSMFDNVAGEITRLLFATRAKLAATSPGVAQIEAPETDKSSVFTVHPGAASFINGNLPSFFEQAMEQLFNFSIIGGVLGSIVIFIGNLWRKQRLSDTQNKTWRLLSILREAKTIPLDRLDQLEEELDVLSGDLLDRLVRDEIGQERINGISVLISEIRTLISRRRNASSSGHDGHGEHEPPGTA